jgi:hypothetical protein
MRYSWTCEQAGGPCLSPDGTNLPPLPSAAEITVFVLGGEVAIGPLPTTFTLTVYKDGRQASVATQLLVEKGAPPVVRMRPLATTKINSNERLILQADVTSLKPGTLRLLWSVVGGPDLDLNSPSVVLTSLESDKASDNP